MSENTFWLSIWFIVIAAVVALSFIMQLDQVDRDILDAKTCEAAVIIANRGNDSTSGNKQLLELELQYCSSKGNVKQ